METRLLLLADYASLEAHTGKLNIIGAFNKIYAQRFPTAHQMMYLVVRIGAELGEFNTERQLEVMLFDEDGQESWRTPNLPFTIPMPAGGRIGEFNAVLALQLMMFEHAGRYEFRVYVDHDLKGVIPLDLELLPQQPEE